MSSRSFSQGVSVGVFVALFGFVATAAAALPGPEKGRNRQGFNLKAAVNVLVNVNRVECNINNLGEVCVDGTNSPVLGGGFWPKGTPDQYIFNSGLQLAGVIPSTAGFEWAGDTVGAYFMDARGTQRQGDGVTLTYNSLDPADASNWPVGAVVRDSDIYNDVLLGRNSISQQDVWVRTWDGNASLLSGRTHPMGILVEERGVAWNFPSGNEDIVYFIYTFYNVTASDPAAYASVPAEIRNEIAAVGRDYQDEVSGKLGVSVPAGGYRIENLYAAFYMDPDVGSAGANYSTAILPFDMAIAYKSDFLESNWSFPPEIFGAPFAANPGFVGVKYLRSPIDPATGQEVGLTMFSNTRNAATGFPDPVGVIQLFRYLSGAVNPAAGDNPCTFPNPIERRLCFLDQVSADTRFYQSSGPFALDPGQSATIVVAYIHAAPVAAPLIASGQIGGDLQPQIPFPGDSIWQDPSKVRTIERIAGWAGETDPDSSGAVTQDEVITVPRSLLAKALVAQAVFDNKFLLPFSPESPSFFLIPGDNQVTVVWQQSASEATGDPFAAVASDPTSPLFDENFREFDVEGYRIYRGRTRGDLRLVAQFDYAGSSLIDFTGGFDYGNACAPELAVTAGCPSFPNTIDLSGEIVQVPPGGRVQLADGSIFLVTGDTLVTGGGSAFPELSNTGVPFAFIDSNVRNSFNYFYAVTAFDVNSLKSGPSSLESPRITKSVVPRAPASNVVNPIVVTSVTGDDGVPLDVAVDFPPIDPNDGTFSQNMPPINSGSLLLGAAVNEALPQGDITVRVDSVGLGWAGGFGPAPPVYYTLSAGGREVQKTFTPTVPVFNTSSAISYEFVEPLIPYDQELSQRLGISSISGNIFMPVQFSGAMTPMAFASQSVSTASGRYGVPGYETSRYLSHSRWLDVGGAEPADPTITSLPDPEHNAGSLTGVDRIWAPSAYRVATGDFGVTIRGQGASGMTAWYPADFVVTWNGDGTVSVRDITHNVTLPPAGAGGSGVGFMNISDILATGLTQGLFDTQVDDGNGGAFDILNYQHIYMTQPTCSNTWWAIPDLCISLNNTAELNPIDFSSPPDGVADGTGIGLWINGEIFYMEMSALPAAGTEWQLRAVSGIMGATCTPELGPVMDDCSNYTFRPNAVRQTVVPGLRFNVTVESKLNVDNSVTDLTKVHTVPDPYYVTNELEQTPFSKVIKFVNLPNQAIIRIYSVSGVLVQVLEHNAVFGGELTWNVRNRNNQFVASGVYFFHVETPDGREKIGRFTVVNFAQ